MDRLGEADLAAGLDDCFDGSHLIEKSNTAAASCKEE
jgi:hypothetical protein